VTASATEFGDITVYEKQKSSDPIDSIDLIKRDASHPLAGDFSGQFSPVF
jgi:hypothetical protein